MCFSLVSLHGQTIRLILSVSARLSLYKHKSLSTLFIKSHTTLLLSA